MAMDSSRLFGLRSLSFLLPYLLIYIQCGVMAEKDHQDSDCSIYRSCLDCLQDPCSRTATSDSQKCHYCNGVCSLERFPFHCPGERGDDCKRPMITDSVTYPSCVIVTPSYIVNLTKGDLIYGFHNKTDRPEHNVQYWIGLCQSVNHFHTNNDCNGLHSTSSPILFHDDTQPPHPDHYPCWFVGSLSNSSLKMLNQSNPKQGVEIDYGTTSCCPQLNGYPGIVGRLDVKMIVRPSIDCHTHTNFWSLESFDLPYPQLTDCSPAQNGEFRVELRTSQLCPDQIVWRLSQQHTHFVCSTLNHNTIRCTLTPKLVFDNKSVSTMSAICSRLVLMIRYVNGTNCSMTSQFKEENDVCVVSVAVGNSLVKTIDVIDIDGSVVGQVNAPRFHSPSQWMKVLGVCLATAGCVLILILLLKVARVRCRKRERVKLDEMRSACENTFLLQPPRRYEEKSRGTNNTPTVATSV